MICLLSALMYKTFTPLVFAISRAVLCEKAGGRVERDRMQ